MRVDRVQLNRYVLLPQVLFAGPTLADLFAGTKTGMTIAATTARIPMTTTSSVRVNARSQFMLI